MDQSKDRILQINQSKMLRSIHSAK